MTNESLSSRLVPKHYVEQARMLDGTWNDVYKLKLGTSVFGVFRRGAYFAMPRLHWRVSTVKGLHAFLSVGAKHKLTVEFRQGRKK